MTRNPYAHPMEPTEPEGPVRLSVLALSSAVLGFLCCIPGVGVIGSILGLLGIIRISQSDGRLAGRGLAFTGLVLGILGTVLWIAAVVGMMATLTGLNVYGQAVRDLQSGNMAAARQMLTPATSQALTDEAAKDFADALTAEMGNYDRLPKGLFEWFGDYSAVGAQIPPSSRGQIGSPRFQIPLPARFDKGRCLVLIHADGNTPAPSGAAGITNIEVVTPSGKVILLLPKNTPTPDPPATAPEPDPTQKQPEPGSGGAEGGTGGDGGSDP
jgi:hypothetical protein